MRKFKRTYFVTAVTLVSALAFAAVSSATHGGQTASILFSKTKKATKKGEPGSLQVALANTDDPATPSPVPPQLNNLVVELASGIKVDGSKFPVCTQSLESLPTSGPGSAQATCGNEAPKKQNALVGTAAATVQIGPNVVNATGLAFNGPGELTIFIRAEALELTTIIHCALGNSPDPRFHTSFQCPIPPLAGGAGAVTSVDFRFERIEKVVKKKKGKKKKKIYSFITGKCPASAEYPYRATFTYNDHETEVLTPDQACAPFKK